MRFFSICICCFIFLISCNRDEPTQEQEIIKKVYDDYHLLHTAPDGCGIYLTLRYQEAFDKFKERYKNFAPVLLTLLHKNQFVVHKGDYEFYLDQIVEDKVLEELACIIIGTTNRQSSNHFKAVRFINSQVAKDDLAAYLESEDLKLLHVEKLKDNSYKASGRDTLFFFGRFDDIVFFTDSDILIKDFKLKVNNYKDKYYPLNFPIDLYDESNTDVFAGFYINQRFKSEQINPLIQQLDPSKIIQSEDGLVKLKAVATLEQDNQFFHLNYKMDISPFKDLLDWNINGRHLPTDYLPHNTSFLLSIISNDLANYLFSYFSYMADFFAPALGLSEALRGESLVDICRACKSVSFATAQKENSSDFYFKMESLDAEIIYQELKSLLINVANKLSNQTADVRELTTRLLKIKWNNSSLFNQLDADRITLTTDFDSLQNKEKTSFEEKLQGFGIKDFSHHLAYFYKEYYHGFIAIPELGFRKDFVFDQPAKILGGLKINHDNNILQFFLKAKK